MPITSRLGSGVTPRNPSDTLVTKADGTAGFVSAAEAGALLLNHGSWTPNGQSTTTMLFDGYLSVAMTVTDATSAQVLNTTHGLGFRQTTSTVLNNEAITWQTNVYISGPFVWRLKFNTDETTLRDFGVGWSSTFPTIATADPAISAFMLRHCTSLGHTNWMLFTNDGAGGGSAQDTGIAADTDIHEVEFKWKTNDLTISLFDATGTLQYTKNFTSNVPACGVLGATFIDLFTRDSGVAKSHVIWGGAGCFGRWA